jgi:hypothetical protein
MELLTAIVRGCSEPANFKAAWHHLDPIHQDHCRAAIRNKFKDMYKNLFGDTPPQTQFSLTGNYLVVNGCSN